jgi:DNA-binding GntR family transcriptional regulator
MDEARVATAPDGSGPRYLKLAEILRAEIRDGRLKPGDSVPTEHELSSTHSVSRFTVREALRQLANDGLIQRKRGSGTIVRADTPVLQQNFTDTRAILQYAASSSFSIEPMGEIHLAAGAARLLKRPEGEAWQLIRGLRTMDGAQEPIAMTDAYIHPRFAAHVAALKPGHEALFSQLNRLAGLRISRVTQEIQAVAATAAEAAALRIALRAPCLRIIRQYYDDSDNLSEMSCSVHPGERFSYTMVIDG